MGLLPDDMYNERWTELDEKKAMLEYRREKRLQEEKKRQARRGWFDAFFPELSGIPFGWVIIGLICVIISFGSLIFV